MSMSTFISDLPGAQDEILHDEDYQTEKDYQENEVETQYTPPPPPTVSSNIKLAFKKKKNEITWYDCIRNELNEENLTLFILLFVATWAPTNEYIRKGLYMTLGSTGYSHLTVTLLKCVGLLLVFILLKQLVFK